LNPETAVNKDIIEAINRENASAVRKDETASRPPPRGASLNTPVLPQRKFIDPKITQKIVSAKKRITRAKVKF
jgi:hypothetical protein